MCKTLDIPDFLADTINPGSYTEVDRVELRELAIHLLVDLHKQERAGAGTRMQLLLHVQPAIDHAAKVGWDHEEIRAEADRRFGHWLIDNAGR